MTRWRMIDVLIVAIAIGIIACGYYLITHRNAPCGEKECSHFRMPD